MLAADAWCRATGRTLGALSSVVVNHGAALERVAAGKPITDVQIEKFAHFLAAAENWPNLEVDAQALAFAQVMGIRRDATDAERAA